MINHPITKPWLRGIFSHHPSHMGHTVPKFVNLYWNGEYWALSLPKTLSMFHHCASTNQKWNHVVPRKSDRFYLLCKGRVFPPVKSRETHPHSLHSHQSHHHKHNGKPTISCNVVNLYLPGGLNPSQKIWLGRLKPPSLFAWLNKNSLTYSKPPTRYTNKSWTILINGGLQTVYS